MAGSEMWPRSNMRNASDELHPTQQGPPHGTDDVEMGNTASTQPTPPQSFLPSYDHHNVQPRQTPESSAQTSKNNSDSSRVPHNYSHEMMSRDTPRHESETFGASCQYSQAPDSAPAQHISISEASFSKGHDEVSGGRRQAGKIRDNDTAADGQQEHRLAESGPRRSEKRRGVIMEGSLFQAGTSSSSERSISPKKSHSRTSSFGQPIQMPIRPSPSTSPGKRMKRKAEQELTHADVLNVATRLENMREEPPALVHYYSTLPTSYTDTPGHADGPLPFSATQPSDTANFEAAFFSTPYEPESEAPPLPRKASPKRVPFTSAVLPPPKYMYKRTNDPNFNIFANGILLFPDLCFALAKVLPPRTLLALYSISRPFHSTCDTRFATMIKSQAERLCPDAAAIFRFRDYDSLCRPDPAHRIPHANSAKRVARVVRLVPGFKWLFMVINRVKTCQEIFAMMAEASTPLPVGCRNILYKIWALMDVPDNVRRVSVVHNRHMWTDHDLYWATFFFVKLDMRLNHPNARHNSASQGRELLLAQERGLSMLWKMLKGTECQTEYEVMKLWIRTFHVPATPEEAQLSAFNIPPWEQGRAQYEYWGRRLPMDPKTGSTGKPVRLSRPDELVRSELVRRRMKLGLKIYMKMIVWGYVDPKTKENMDGKDFRGRRVTGPGWDEIYEDDDEVSGAKVGDDELLDLGDKLEDISIGVKKEGRSETDVRRDREDEQYLEGLMRASEEEAY